MSKVAVVTGGNKGIGFAIVKGLCLKFDGVVYLTARDNGRGQEAVAELERLGCKPVFHQLDITDVKSVNSFKDFIKEKHGGMDILVNNAAIAFKGSATEHISVQAEKTIFVNYFCLVSVCDILFPLMRKGGRVVNLSSSVGHLSQIPGESLRLRFKNPELTLDALSDLMNEFIEATKDNTYKDKGWPSSTYAVSKVGVSALTFIQQRNLMDKDIIINCVHPGYVDTDMTSHMGPLTPDRGAEAPLYLALDAPDDVRGVYMWHDKRIVDWYSAKPEKE